MHCDTFTAVGDKEVCQDYVASYHNNTVIVTDGCSGAEKTDIGARLINCYFGGGSAFGPNLVDVVRSLDLPDECLYSTMLKIRVDIEKQQLHFLRVGDGFLCYNDGKTTTIEQYCYTQNAPYYVGYWFLDQIEKFKELKQHLVKKLWNFDDKMKLVSKEFTIITDPSEMLAEETFYDCREWKWAAVASDGLDSFCPTQSDLLEEVILPKFFAFKNLYGNFLKRRAKAALRELKEDGYDYFDDISIGGIVL